jgi:hypothetical protein
MDYHRREMKHILTLRPYMRSRIGQKSETGPVIEYQVPEMLPAEDVRIRNCGSADYDSWRIFHVKNGVDTGWTGDYKTAGDALAVLQRETDFRATV